MVAPHSGGKRRERERKRVKESERERKRVNESERERKREIECVMMVMMVMMMIAVHTVDNHSPLGDKRDM